MGFKTKHLQGEEVKMADNVSFKVYLKDPPQGEETEVRRFVVDKEVSTSLVYIKEKLVSIFPVLADKIFSISWTDEAGSPTCSRPRTGTSARCSTFSSRSRSRHQNIPGIPLGCFAVVLSAGNQSLYTWVPALGGHQPPIVTDLNISGYGYICTTGIYVAIYISMCFLKLQFEIHF